VRSGRAAHATSTNHTHELLPPQLNKFEDIEERKVERKRKREEREWRGRSLVATVDAASPLVVTVKRQVPTRGGVRGRGVTCDGVSACDLRASDNV